MKKTPFRGSVGASGATKKLFTPVSLIVLVAVAVVIAAGITWLNYVYTNPDRIFWSMVDNSLKTASYTRRTVQDDGSQRIEQVVQTTTSPYQLVHSQTTISQQGPNAATVITENIGTPTEDYVRYTNILTAQKNAKGQPLDFSKLTNVWGKSRVDTPGDTSGQLYNESVLSVIPFGDLSSQQRHDLIDLMKKSNAYTYTVANVDHTGWLRRPYYTYTVNVNAAAYIQVLKQYARASGLTQLEKIDPAQYAQSQPVQVQLGIDAWSNQLRQVSYGQGARVETIGSYGQRLAKLALPSETVPVEELQNRLQAIQ